MAKADVHVCRDRQRVRSDLLGELCNSRVEGDHPSAEVHVALSGLPQALCLSLVLSKSLLKALLHVLLHGSHCALHSR